MQQPNTDGEVKISSFHDQQKRVRTNVWYYKIVVIAIAFIAIACIILVFLLPSEPILKTSSTDSSGFHFHIPSWVWIVLVIAAIGFGLWYLFSKTSFSMPNIGKTLRSIGKFLLWAAAIVLIAWYVHRVYEKRHLHDTASDQTASPAVDLHPEIETITYTNGTPITLKENIPYKYDQSGGKKYFFTGLATDSLWFSDKDHLLDGKWMIIKVLNQTDQYVQVKPTEN